MASLLFTLIHFIKMNIDISEDSCKSTLKAHLSALFLLLNDSHWFNLILQFSFQAIWISF